MKVVDIPVDEIQIINRMRKTDDSKIKELSESIDNWSYDKLDEVNRIVPLIKEHMKKNGII